MARPQLDPMWGWCPVCLMHCRSSPVLPQPGFMCPDWVLQCPGPMCPDWAQSHLHKLGSSPALPQHCVPSLPLPLLPCCQIFRPMGSPGACRKWFCRLNLAFGLGLSTPNINYCMQDNNEENVNIFHISNEIWDSNIKFLVKSWSVFSQFIMVSMGYRSANANSGIWK